VYLPDRGGRRECNRKAESSNECHQGKFRAHDAASYLHLLHRIWAAGTAIQIPEPDPPARSRFASIYSLARILLTGGFKKENTRFHIGEGAPIAPAMPRLAAQNQSPETFF